METGTTIEGQVLHKVAVDLPIDPIAMIRCGTTTIYKVIEVYCKAVSKCVTDFDKNAETLEEFTASLAEWANEQEKKIQEALDGATGDGSLTVGLGQLSGEVKTLLTNIEYSQLGAMVKDMLLTKELKDKLIGLQNYTLPKASSNVLGGVTIGHGINVDANGKISTSLDKLGISVDNGVMKIVLGENTYSIHVDEDESSPVLQMTKVIASCGDVEYDENGNPVSDYVVSGREIIVQENSKVTFVANKPYFSLCVPMSWTLSSLVMAGAFGDLDLLAENDFIATDDYIGKDGTTYHVYLYVMPAASEDNPVTYTYSVSK